MLQGIRQSFTTRLFLKNTPGRKKKKTLDMIDSTYRAGTMGGVYFQSPLETSHQKLIEK